jgi:hypothetical protein
LDWVSTTLVPHVLPAIHVLTIRRFLA